LQTEKLYERVQRTAARDRAFLAQCCGYPAIRDQDQVYGDVDETLEPDDPVEALAETGLRIRLPRGQYRHGRHSGRGSCRGAGSGGEPDTEIRPEPRCVRYACMQDS